MARIVYVWWWTVLAGCTPPSAQDSSKTTPTPSGADIIGILITPSEVIVPSGGSLQLEAMGLNAERQAVTLTDAVNWQVEDGAVLTVSNEFDEEGMLLGLANGVTTVTAELDGLQSAPARAVVTAADLERLSVTPSELVVAQGDSIQLSAEAGFSDGSASTVNGQVRWITADGRTATISTDGMMSAMGVGLTEVWVEWKGVQSDPVSVEVIEILPTAASDLTIESVNAVMSDGSLTVSAAIKNSGSAPVAGFWVDLFLEPDGEPSAGAVPDAYRLVDYVGADAQTIIVFEVPTEQSGVEFAVVVDALDAITESDETNNVAWGSADEESVSPGDAAGLPNLSVAYAGGFSTDSGTEFWIDVTNAGSAPASGFYIDVFVDRGPGDEPPLFADGDAWVLVGDLGVGDTVYETLVLEVDCPACGSWVMIDGYDFVAESDETDNTRYLSVE